MYSINEAKKEYQSMQMRLAYEKKIDSLTMEERKQFVALRELIAFAITSLEDKTSNIQNPAFNDQAGWMTRRKLQDLIKILGYTVTDSDKNDYWTISGWSE
jgi:hypothetical protein